MATTTKRKSIVDTSGFSKRAKLWFSEGLDGLSSYLKLMPLDKLVSEHQTKKRSWVGAYPGLSDQQGDFYIRGVLLKDDTDQDQFLPSRHGTSAAKRGSQAVEDSKPYQLEPYTKVPSFTAPDFQESSALRSLTPSPLAYGRPSRASSVDSSLRESSTPPATNKSNSLQTPSRIGALSYSRFEQSSLLRARPRIYAGKTHRPTSLLQSKYFRDETLARQRLFERHNHIHPKQEQGKGTSDMTVTWL
ncbi:MAG: hypothetical protein J3Q66DRAFT_123684 [Benniella sp.]|nr:MAG: hypothetical protein J3Q66DRAFT_123684 [Benniella sp.]